MSALVAAAFIPWPRSRRQVWPRELAAAVACILPVALWQAALCAHYGAISKSGLGAMGIPLLACLDKCKGLLPLLRRGGFAAVRDDVCVVVAYVVQIAFVLGRPRPHCVWWRFAAPFAGLALFVGPQPWSDAITAIPRTLLPLTLAFNVLAPRTPAGLALLLAGNLTVLAPATPLEGATASEQTTFVEGITGAYSFGWHRPEHLRRRTWRWASGPAGLTLHNPLAETRRIGIDFNLVVLADRTVTIHTAEVKQQVFLPASRRMRVHFGPLDLGPRDPPSGTRGTPRLSVRSGRRS